MSERRRDDPIAEIGRIVDDAQPVATGKVEKMPAGERADDIPLAFVEEIDRAFAPLIQAAEERVADSWEGAERDAAEAVLGEMKAARDKLTGRNVLPFNRGQPAPRTSTRPSWRNHVFTAADLEKKHFDPIAYIVPGLIPEGLTILAGRPKVGKSWLALDLALGIAGGFYVLGNIKLEEADVLYAALEDNQRRLRSRIERILTGSKQFWPPRLTLATRWRRLNAGGVDDAKEWAASVKRPRLMIFDTLAGVRPDRNNRDTLYEGDYKALTELQVWAGESGLSGLILHHTRKMESEDPIDTVSGSLGLTGCVDTVAVLARTGSGPTLYVRGRDVEEQEKAMVFNKGTCRWTVRGDAEEVHQSEIRQKIVTVLRNVTLVSQPIGPKDIANLCDVREDAVRQRLPGMVEAGQIIKVSRGLYVAANRSDLLSA